MAEHEDTITAEAHSGFQPGAPQLTARRLRIGEVLVEMGVLDQAQLDVALRVHRETGVRLGRVLVQERIADSADIARALARRLGHEYVDLFELSVDDATLRMLPFELSSRYEAIAIDSDATGVTVAMADPTNVFAIDELRIKLAREVRVRVATPEAVDIMLARIVNLDDDGHDTGPVGDESGEVLVDLEDIRDNSSDAPATRLCNQIVTQAVLTGATDVHLEPQPDGLVVRFRKDGLLLHATTAPHRLRRGIVSRLKILAGLDLSEHRRPQEGRRGLIVGGRPVDLRLAVLPTEWGESATLRMHDRASVAADLDQLDMLPAVRDRLRAAWTQPDGLVLLAGPSGTGTTTTLYAAMAELRGVERRIISVEDPVEVRMSGVTQVTVEPIGVPYAAAVRAAMHSDPDVVAIGELRDAATAAVAVEAAMTGHLVVSTLPASSAADALVRMRELDVEPGVAASAVLAVLGQTLTRRLCECAEAWTPEEDELQSLELPPSVLPDDGTAIELRRPVGCERCGHKGFRGRIALHEVLVVSRAVADCMVARATVDEIRRVAEREGMEGMYLDGMRKVLLGQTTVEEVRRVVRSLGVRVPHGVEHLRRAA